MVAAAIEDPDDRHGLVEHGVCDHHPLAVADRPQTGAEVFSRQTAVREIGQALTERDDGLGEARGVVG